jgi:hypothetical protein
MPFHLPYASGISPPGSAWESEKATLMEGNSGASRAWTEWLSCQDVPWMATYAANAVLQQCNITSTQGLGQEV